MEKLSWTAVRKGNTYCAPACVRANGFLHRLFWDHFGYPNQSTERKVQ